MSGVCEGWPLSTVHLLEENLLNSPEVLSPLGDCVLIIAFGHIHIWIYVKLSNISLESLRCFEEGCHLLEGTRKPPPPYVGPHSILELCPNNDFWSYPYMDINISKTV